MNFKNIFFLGLVGFFVGAPLWAHHAMEFIEMESYSTAPKGQFVLHLHYDYMVDDQDNSKLDHWEFTPGISYGLTNRLMVDLHTHLSKFGADHVVEEHYDTFSPDGPSPFMEAAAGSLQYRLTMSSPVEFAVALSYEHPFERSKELIAGEKVYGFTAIANYEFGVHSAICLNLKREWEAGENVDHWALGLKTPFTSDSHGIAGGLEFLGDFDNSFSTLGGLYIPLGSSGMVMKTGIEIGSGERDLRANLTVMYVF